MQSFGLLPCLGNSCIGGQNRQIFPKRTAAAGSSNASTSISFQVLQQLATARRVKVKEQEHAHSIKVIKELDDLYEELEEVFYSKRGYIIPKQERSLVDATGGSATYGELMPEGIEELVRTLALTEDDVFMDLGSGLGRIVMQVAMTSPVRKAIGLELSGTRHDQAMWVLEQLRERHGHSLSNVELDIRDITRTSFEGATHFMLCSTAFSASGCKMVADRLASTSTFQVLVASRQLPPSPLLRKAGEVKIAYSWNLGGTAHVYTKNDLTNAPTACLSQFYSADGLCWLPHDRSIHIPIVAEESTLAHLLEQTN